ncbi:hypothetical protein H0H92_008971 [Tricholoma furcatifolium]|nr:hypothetical protein H0H92_008971 [Tricholoma furcatifolium]
MISEDSEYDGHTDKFWSFYNAETAQRDSKMTKAWESDMKITLIFSGLFSATIAAFMVQSQKLLRQNPVAETHNLLAQLVAARQSKLGDIVQSQNLFQQDPAVDAHNLLAQVVPGAQQLWLRESSAASTSFEPSRAVIAINILWGTSLVCTLGAALCSILVLKSIHSFSQRVHEPGKQVDRARIRTFLAEGMERWRVEGIVDGIPKLLHLSLFLFLAGLVVFVTRLCVPVSAVVAAPVSLLVVLYGIATVAPWLDLASPFETVFTRSSALSSALDFSEPGSEDPPSPDVYALACTVGETRHDNARFVEFLKTVPGFLSMSSESSKSHKIWGAIFDELEYAEALKEWICEMLLACLPITTPTNPLEASQHRAVICIEALYSISQHEMKHIPIRGAVGFSALSRYITRAISSDRDCSLSITKGICALSLMTSQQIVSPFVVRASDSHSVKYRVPKDIYGLSRKADKVLRDIEALQHILEAKFQEYESRPHGYEVGVQNVVQQFFDALNTISKVLWEWRLMALPTVFEWTKEEFHEFYQWYFFLPKDGYVLKHRFLGADETDLEVELYALQVMALMRKIGLYTSLPAVTSNVPFTTSEKTDAAFCQELGPLLRLLDLLKPSTNHEIQPSTTIKCRFIFGGDGVYVPLRERPILIEHLGPFGTLGCILEDVKDTGGSIVSLLNLVAKFKSFAPRVVEPHVVRAFLENIFGDPSFFVRQGKAVISAGLFIAVLRVILDWEKESESCPFSSSDVEFLLDFLPHLDHNHAVAMAYRLLVPTSSDRAKIESEVKDKHISPMKAIYNHITVGRL